MMSTSPLVSALTCCCASRNARFHSTRSTNTFLPPVVPDGGSLRGTYFVFFRYTALSPGLYSSRLNTYGPEPV